MACGCGLPGASRQKTLAVSAWAGLLILIGPKGKNFLEVLVMACRLFMCKGTRSELQSV